MKRFLTCLCLIVTSLALCSGLAGAAEKVRINLLSTPFGTGSYVLGTALENIVNKGDYPILISHAETPGQAFNVNKLNADPAARKNTVGTGEAATALVNGQVDAATIGGYMDPVSGKFSPAPQTVEVVASGRDLHHLDWTEDAVKNTAAKDIQLIPFKVPANSVEGQTAPIFIGADTHGLFAHPDFPEEYAYILAKAMIENIDAFAQYHALGALMSREGLIKGWSPEQIHPGALRAYKEAGLL